MIDLLLRLVSAVALAASAAVAQPPPAPQKPCSGAEYRQFDFWVGEWEVRAAGALAGTNRIEKIANDCALQETWTSVKGGGGRSLNMYSKHDGRWHQTWVDSGGTLLLLSGGLQGDRMVLQGETGKTLNRITWTPVESGRVRQLWESSADGGKTWTTAFDGLYTRK